MKTTSKTKDPDASMRPATVCVHSGTSVDERTGGVNSPIFTSTAYAVPNPTNQNIYPRYFNVVNQRVVAQKLAALEKGEDAIVFGSGMAAISTLLLAHLNPGEHVIFQADLYGGTHHLISAELERFGIEISHARTPAEFRSAIRPNTRVIYVESPSNPLLRCVDLAAVAKVSREHRLVSMIDNTFASPINQNPLALGIDAVVHSATKYLNGHSDVNAGAVISTRKIVAKVTACAVNLGGTLDSHACYQLERGLKTLAIRVRQHNENAGKLARFLEKHKAVARVNYPGLASHPDYKVARRQMRGFGGMLSFEIRRARGVERILKKFRLVTPALSLGGVETLITIPRLTSHRSLTAGERKAAGISDGLMRVSVGIEDIADIIQDFDQALASL